jgi:LEA14-like dessication related protein
MSLAISTFRLAAMRCALALTALVFAAGAASADPAPLQPRVTIKRIDRVDLGNQQATLDMTLDVKNPTGVDLALQSLKFRCALEGVASANGQSTVSVTIPSNDHALVPVRILVSNDSLLAIMSLVASGASSVNYRLDGTAEVGPMLLDVPFSQRGRISLPH